MKNLLLIFVAQICMLQLEAQHFALGNDKMNVAYLGVDNPITVAVENVPCNRIVLKADNGTISGSQHKFIFRGKEVGAAYITVYEKKGNDLKKIGKYVLRVKRIPPPNFKIGPYSIYRDRKIQAIVLGSQDYARAELDFFDIDAICILDSFSVKIFHADSGETNSFLNITGKIDQPIKDAFLKLKTGDIIFFNKIFAKGPDGLQWELDPVILTIEN